jgi:hypothetical protein
VRHLKSAQSDLTQLLRLNARLNARITVLTRERNELRREFDRALAFLEEMAAVFDVLRQQIEASQRAERVQ